MQMTGLAMAIMALLTLKSGEPIRHVRDHVLPPMHRVEQLAEHVEHGAFVAGVPRAVLTALWYYESTLNHKAFNRESEAFGIGQLLPSSRWHKAWLKDCARDPYACELKDSEHAAMALRFYLDNCGTMLRAITAYRIGHCASPGPRAKVTFQLAQVIQHRMHHPSKERIVAPRLP